MVLEGVPFREAYRKVASTSKTAPSMPNTRYTTPMKQYREPVHRRNPRLDGGDSGKIPFRTVLQAEAELVK